MRILDAEQTRVALPMTAAIAAMVDAFGTDIDLPQRQLLGASFFMPARVGNLSGIKVVSVVPGNPAGIVVVFGEDGAPIGCVDGPTLTSIRTGAGAGLATRVLASPDPRRFAILGAGAMAYDQIAAVLAVTAVESVVIWSRTNEKAQSLALRMGAEVADSPDGAVRGADIVTTVTPATAPLFDPSSLGDDVHINAVGAFTPDMVEIPAQTVRAAFTVVDDRTAASAEAGDLIQAGTTPNATLGELLDGFERPAGITMFKSVGIASQDVAAAAKALANAEALGIGTLTGQGVEG